MAAAAAAGGGGGGAAAAAAAPKVDLDALRAQVAAAAAAVRSLKAEGKGVAELGPALETLASLRKALEEATAADEGAGGGAKWPVDRKALDECMARRMIVVPSFEIHRGVAGFFDYGPPGCALKVRMSARSGWE